ncbi:MAG TPA: hypothetical protein PK625_08405 [Spirochaetales bacterium]|nr:hypothetical protein [Spirochaetia bacterium]HPE37158.1 hypothetical protein [Spirochaetales bacterium]
MISREDFIFTIGYEGELAVVDKSARARYGKLDTQALVREGLYRAAFASALYSGKDDEFQQFAAAYNAQAGTSYTKPEDFQRLFGVKLENVRRVMSL